ncbi:MAG: hypothetical protein D6679_12900 [Candidatus Hydrogenedentota bacterium]|nr:MAG: hypothetical protein D6679_12900 [Candidatus Hydrogenedentota bacterium]
MAHQKEKESKKPSGNPVKKGGRSYILSISRRGTTEDTKEAEGKGSRSTRNGTEEERTTEHTERHGGEEEPRKTRNDTEGRGTTEHTEKGKEKIKKAKVKSQKAKVKRKKARAGLRAEERKKRGKRKNVKPTAAFEVRIGAWGHVFSLKNHLLVFFIGSCFYRRLFFSSITSHSSIRLRSRYVTAL